MYFNVFQHLYLERYTYSYIGLLSRTVAGTKGDRYKCMIRWCSGNLRCRRNTALHLGIRRRLGHSWVLPSQDKGRTMYTR